MSTSPLSLSSDDGDFVIVRRTPSPPSSAFGSEEETSPTTSPIVSPRDTLKEPGSTSPFSIDDELVAIELDLTRNGPISPPNNANDSEVLSDHNNNNATNSNTVKNNNNAEDASEYLKGPFKRLGMFSLFSPISVIDGIGQLEEDIFQLFEVRSLGDLAGLVARPDAEASLTEVMPDTALFIGRAHAILNQYSIERLAPKENANLVNDLLELANIPLGRRAAENAAKQPAVTPITTTTTTATTPCSPTVTDLLLHREINSSVKKAVDNIMDKLTNENINSSNINNNNNNNASNQGTYAGYGLNTSNDIARYYSVMQAAAQGGAYLDQEREEPPVDNSEKHVKFAEKDETFLRNSDACWDSDSSSYSSVAETEYFPVEPTPSERAVQIQGQQDKVLENISNYIKEEYYSGNVNPESCVLVLKSIEACEVELLADQNIYTIRQLYNLGPQELDMLSKKRSELLYSEASGVVMLTKKNKALDNVKVAVSSSQPLWVYHYVSEAVYQQIKEEKLVKSAYQLFAEYLECDTYQRPFHAWKRVHYSYLKDTAKWMNKKNVDLNSITDADVYGFLVWRAAGSFAQFDHTAGPKAIYFSWVQMPDELRNNAIVIDQVIAEDTRNPYADRFSRVVKFDLRKLVNTYNAKIHRVESQKANPAKVDSNHWLATTLCEAEELVDPLKATIYDHIQSIWKHFEPGESDFQCVPHGCVVTANGSIPYDCMKLERDD